MCEGEREREMRKKIKITYELGSLRGLMGNGFFPVPVDFEVKKIIIFDTVIWANFWQ